MRMKKEKNNIPSYGLNSNEFIILAEKKLIRSMNNYIFLNFA